jgi:hypothetical protein
MVLLHLDLAGPVPLMRSARSSFTEGPTPLARAAEPIDLEGAPGTRFVFQVRTGTLLEVPLGLIGSVFVLPKPDGAVELTLPNLVRPALSMKGIPYEAVQGQTRVVVERGTASPVISFLGVSVRFGVA